MNEIHKPQFRGVWCPPEVMQMVFDKTISTEDAFLLMIVESLVQHGGEGCFASNEWLGDKLGVSADRAARQIAKLKELGLLVQTKFDGRKRWLETSWSRLGEAEADSAKTPSLHRRKDRVENTKGEYTPAPAAKAALSTLGSLLPVEVKKPTSHGCMAAYISQYEKKYGKGSYKFEKQDAAIVKNIYTKLGKDQPPFERLIERFFLATGSMFTGHTLTALAHTWRQFTDAVANANEESGDADTDNNDMGAVEYTRVEADPNRRESVDELYENLGGPGEVPLRRFITAPPSGVKPFKDGPMLELRRQWLKAFFPDNLKQRKSYLPQ